jgi:hypothetical protein
MSIVPMRQENANHRQSVIILHRFLHRRLLLEMNKMKLKRECNDLDPRF